VHLRARAVTLQIRAPEESEREAVGDVLQISLNLDPSRRASRLARMPLADLRVAADGDRVVSTAGEFRFLQWFGGRQLPISGIFGVATLPEHRGGGVMRDVVTALLREAYDRGTPITALYPAVLGPYRSLGYEIAGTYHQHQLRIESIPAGVGDASIVREYTPEDLPAVRECWSRTIRHANGTLEPTGDGWWVHRTFNPAIDPTLRAVVVPGGDGGVEAFASFVRSSTTGELDVAFGLECEPMAAATEGGLRSLLAYLRGYRGIGRWVRWAGAPHEPVSMLIPDHAVLSEWRYPWMLRLLRVDDAFRGRGWPAGAAVEAVFSVEDGLFPANAGSWRLTVHGGEAKVARESGSPGPKPLAIGALSSMFSGYLRPWDAVRLGLLDADDPAVEAFATLFAGPDPWTGLFF
jgi:predicted acetyltransferase